MSNKRQWYQTFYTYIWVFNTGRGLSVCIRLPHNVGIIYDLGCSDDFSPTKFITDYIAPRLTPYEQCKIAQCIMSHPHADHIWEVESILECDNKRPPIYPHLVTCPNDKIEKEKVDFSRIESEDNKKLIAAYRKSYEKRKPPLQTIQTKVPCNVPNVEYGFYYMPAPQVSKIYEEDNRLYGNGLSIVLYLRHGYQSILIPGDITPEVLKSILEEDKPIEKRYTYFSNPPKNVNIPDDLHERTSTQPKLKELLRERGLSVLLTPHHGLESCYSPELFECIKDNKPIINVISEKRHLSETDGQIASKYQSEEGAIGLEVDIDGKKEQRYSVSTRNGHHILIVFQGTNRLPRIYLRKKPEDLLEIV